MPSKTQTSGRVLNLKPSTFETIDKAILKWVDEALNIHSTTNDGWKKVPVVWITAERAYQIKNKREMRSVDSEALIFPLITYISFYIFDIYYNSLYIIIDIFR